MSNKKIGNQFESELCDILSANGFWAHNMAQNSAGQPADIIAVKDRIAVLIDCKVCENDEFPLRRIEQNQETAMELWKSCGNTNGWFALKLSDDNIYMIALDDLILMRFITKVLNVYDIKNNGINLESWLKIWN